MSHLLVAQRLSSSPGRFQGDKDDFVIDLAVDGETGRIGAGPCEDELTDRKRFPIRSGLTARLGAETVMEDRILRFTLRMRPGAHIGNGVRAEEVAEEPSF